MSRALSRRRVAAGLAAGLVAGPALAAGGPRRVVSLSPCLDVILVNVADRGQIAAISHYARDPNGSNIYPLSKTFPITYETAEEIVALSPDLVLTARHSSPATRSALDRLGIPSRLFPVPETVKDSLAQVAEIAAAVGRPQRGEAVVAAIRAALAAAAPGPNDPPLSALVFESGGFASAEGTLMDEMMRRTGFRNAATRYGLKRTGDVPLEHVLADPPDVLLAGSPKPGAPTWADRVLAHPALRRLPDTVHVAPFPQRLMYCGGPVLIETAAMLARARRGALAERAARG